MKFSFEGSAQEFAALTGRATPLFGDLPPPPPPNPIPPCEFSEQECTTLKSIAAAIYAAPSGSFLTTEDNTIRTIAHPTATATIVWSETVGDWTAGAWPP